MNNNYFISTFGTFGNPNGFRQSFLFIDQSMENVAREIKTFDLNTVAITLFPGSKIYAIRKEFAGRKNTTAYSLYTYAKEQNSDRGGTFIGSSLVFVGNIPDEGAVIDCLNKFHQNLVENNVQDDVITVIHSNNFIVNKPKDFDKIALNQREAEDLDYIKISDKSLLVYSKLSPAILKELFKKCIDLLNVYDSIYFTSDYDVAQFARKKGIFNTIEVEVLSQELQKLQEHRKQLVQAYIKELQTEKRKIEEDKQSVIEDTRKQIEQNQVIQQNNQKKIDSAKSNLEKIGQRYDEHIKQIVNTINELGGRGKLERVKQTYNQNRRNFINDIEQYSTPSLLNNLSQPNINSGQTQRQEINPNENTQSRNNNDRQKNVELRLDWYKILCFILFPLWIGTLVYFIYIKEIEPTKTDVAKVSDTVGKTIQQVSEEPSQEQEVEAVPPLAPKPDDELKEKKYKAVEEKLKKGIGVTKVVEIIFMTHPFIKRAYVHQEKAYANYLIEINKDSFTDTTLTKEILKRIPYDTKTK